MFTGVRGPGGVETPVHLELHPGAGIRHRPGVSRRARRGAAAAFGFPRADLADAALAAPAVRGEVVVPPGVVHRQDGSRPGYMLVAVLLAGAEFVEEVGVGLLGALRPVPLSGGAGGPEVRAVDRAEPVRAAELRPRGLPGLRVPQVFLPPPAPLLEDRREVLPELRDGPAFGDGLVDLGADVLQEVDLHRLGDGEGVGVLFEPDIAEGEAGAEVAPAEVVQRLLRGRPREPEAGAAVSHRGRSRRR